MSRTGLILGARHPPDAEKAGWPPGFHAKRGRCRDQVHTTNPEGLTTAILAA
ncbi:hypothetical protein GCM10022199_25930 [Marihabitans asiaticum]